MSHSALLDPDLDPGLVPVLGEFAWHAVTVDATLDAVSEAHDQIVARWLAESGLPVTADTQVLEVAAYAHTTGYLASGRLGCSTTLCDISPGTLRLGRTRARAQGLDTSRTTCVAGDFHDLPFESGQFHAVYICSALHHTVNWDRVLGELVRVLAPGGVLMLENEPCRRSFCHYAFRTNRQEAFGGLETALQREGLIWTVAEPYLGSRSEALFGMIENQEIPLHDLVGAVDSACDVVGLTVAPECYMGELEHEMVARRDRPIAETAEWLRALVTERLARAAAAATDADRGMGFVPPEAKAVEDLCTRTAGALAALPAPGHEGFRLALADLFGASVHIVARKRGVAAGAVEGRLRADYPSVDGVTLGFPPHIARLLDPSRHWLPDIQHASVDALEAAFHPSEWAIENQRQHAIRVAAPRVEEPSVRIDVPSPGPLLFMLRCYAGTGTGPWRLAFRVDGLELAGFDVFCNETLLFTRVIQAPRAGELRVSLSMSAIAQGAEAGPVRVSFAGAIPLSA